MLPRDTTLEAARVQLAILRRRGVEGRAKLVFELSQSQRRRIEAGIRHRHPEYDDRRVMLARARMTLGTDLFGKAYPGVEVAP